MRLEVSQVQSEGFVEVMTSHKGQRIAWNTPTYARIKHKNPEKVFDEINSYLEYMGPEVQDVVWGSFIEIRNILESGSDPNSIAANVRIYVNEMYSYMPMESFRRWLLAIGQLHIPAEIQDKITTDSRYDDAEQTYLKHHYVDLATVALAVKLMIPIWGEYISAVTINNNYKEMEALGLIYSTDIVTYPRGETVMDKLQNYINRRIEDQKLSMASIFHNQGSAEMPVQMLAKAIVRRLTIVPLCDPTSHSIISNIHWYVKTNLKPGDRNAADKVTDKDVGGEKSGDEEDKTSFIETNKIKYKVSIGDAESFNFSSGLYQINAQKVDPTIDLEILEQCWKRSKEINQHVTHLHQIRLAQWVTAKAFPARAYGHINNESIHNLLATTQALLWHWKFYDLALLTTVDLMYDDAMTFLPPSPKSGARITANAKQELASVFPHLKPLKVKLTETDPEAKTESYQANAINNLTTEIRSKTWTYLGPRALADLADHPEGRRAIAIANTLKNSITQLVIHLANISR